MVVFRTTRHFTRCDGFALFRVLFIIYVLAYNVVIVNNWTVLSYLLYIYVYICISEIGENVVKNEDGK